MTGFSFRHPLLVNKETMEMIDEEKKKGMKFYGLNIGDHVDEGRHGFPIPPLSCGRMIPGLSVSPFQVCNSLWEFSNGVCKELK